MGLSTDKYFVSALRADSILMEAVSNRIYGTAIPLSDEDVDNAPVPYIVVTFDGLTNDGTTKDGPYEGDYDLVTIGVVVAGKNLTQLHELTERARKAVLDYVTTNDTPITDYQFSAEDIIYDSLKPCFGQKLIWQCDVDAFEDEGESR